MVFGKSVTSGHAQSARAISLFLLIVPRSLAVDNALPNKAWTILQAGLGDVKADKRAAAVSALGVMTGDRRAIDAAENALNDSNASVRRAGIVALGDMNSNASLPKIKALINDADVPTVVAIAAVLTKFKDPKGYDLYYEILTGKRKGGSIVEGLKDKKALEKMGAESVIGFLPFGGVATGTYDYFQKNTTSHANLDITAIAALAEDPDRDPVIGKALVQASFGGKEVVQVAALRALARRGDPVAVDDISPAMDSDKPLTSYTAAATVLHLLQPRANQPVKPEQRKRMPQPSQQRDSGNVQPETQ